MSLSFLSWIDNRTILGCLIILTATFAFVFMGISRMHASMRGSKDFSLSYFSALIGCILMATRGNIPYFVSVVLGNTFIFCSFALIYQGILSFFQKPGRLYPIWIAIGLATIPLTWFSEVHDRIVPRIVVISMVYTLIRGLIAFELFRNAANKRILYLFACFMSLYTLSGINRAVFSLVYGAPQDFMKHNSLQSGMLVVEIIFVCIMAIFKLVMLYSELLSRVESQSHQDAVSGSLNRLGIELKLAVELKRLERSSNQKLSVALIDIDYFKTINDTEGHAAGDHALRKVVAAIASQLRAYDFLGRFGGDEFLLVLPQTSCSGAHIVADRVANAVRTFFASSKASALTVSIGLSEAVPGEHSVSLLSRADQALYEAKHAGRNCTRAVMPIPDRSEAVQPHISIENLLSSPEADLIQS